LIIFVSATGDCFGDAVGLDLEEVVPLRETLAFPFVGLTFPFPFVGVGLVILEGVTLAFALVGIETVSLLSFTGVDLVTAREGVLFAESGEPFTGVVLFDVDLFFRGMTG